VKIELSRCRIRDWRADDAPALVRHADDRRVWRNLRDAFPHPYTPEHAADWLARACAAEPRTAFALEVQGEAAGGIGLRLGEDVHRRTAEVGYWLGAALWGRGIMPEALQAFSAWAFASFDLCRLEAMPFEWNTASCRVLEKAGWALEARLRQNVTKDGETIDQWLYVRLRS
jgi:RimJ/RimL family protein N-acetyltransferase